MKTRWRVVHDRRDYLVIEDIGPWDEYASVTNAAEDVVAELVDVLDGRRLYYYDSDGRLDQLLIEDGKFVGFSPGGPK